MKLTILMPSLNEEEAIGHAIKNVPVAELHKYGLETDFLIVDGGSVDKTREIAQNLGAEVLASKKGYGRQYQLGFQRARGDIIVTADSDNSYPMEEIPQLVKILLDENLDFITTNRFAYIREGAMRKLNRFGNWGLTIIVNLLFGLKLKDSQSGMWIFRKEVLKKIKLVSNGMSLSQEIKIEAFKKLHAREVDSSYYKRGGEAKLRILQDGIDNLWHLIKKRFDLL